MKRLRLERRGAKKVQIMLRGEKHEGETSKQGSGKRTTEENKRAHMPRKKMKGQRGEIKDADSA